LATGCIPLPLLRQHIEEWIEGGGVTDSMPDDYVLV
jgi:hypothetical protein